MPRTLADLPDDILRIILAELNSARDLRALALQCRRLNRLILDEGWRVFVRTRFRSLDIPVSSLPQHPSWTQLADSLTWQSRNWDRRAIRYEYLRPVDERRSKGKPYQPVVDVHYDFEMQNETLIWGAGENIVARYRQRTPRGEPSKISWGFSEGARFGYSAGRGDVRALAILKDRTAYNGDRAFLAGRDNGELALLSAEPHCFGRRLIRFQGESTGQAAPGGGIANPLAHHSTINSVDVLDAGPKLLAAAATKTRVLVYDIPQHETKEVDPSTFYALTGNSAASPAISSDSQTQICHATWMGQSNTIAVSVKGCQDPLRYLTLTPSGWVSQAAAKNRKLESNFGIRYGNVCPHSLCPIQPQGGKKGGTNLLLSAWRDGTCRLQDLRTPSAFDMVYQDDLDPAATMEVLMAWGTERFVGGGMDAGLVKIFDFRWTKGYHHTTGLTCADRVPYPPPCQPFLRDPANTAVRRSRSGAKCDHLTGKACRWHGLARHSYYRPNSCFLMSRAMYETQVSTSSRRVRSDGSIWSFAKASDCMPNFYIGVSGGLIESTLNPYTLKPGHDPNFGFEDWTSNQPVGINGYTLSPIRAKLMETGDGRMGGRTNGSYAMPPLWCIKNEILGAQGLPKGKKRSPLDGEPAKIARADRAQPPDPRNRLDEQFECR